MKKASLIMALLWGVFPFVVNATKNQNSVDWVWFTIIWITMGVSICFTTYLFHIIEKTHHEEIEEIRETLKKYS
jgi:hypothetical protein